MVSSASPRGNQYSPVGTPFVEPPRNGTVDPRGQVVQRPVPTHRNRSCAREDLVLVVDEVELVIGKLLGQARPVAVEHVTVVVVLGQHVLRPLPGGVGEVGTLADRDRAACSGGRAGVVKWREVG